MREKCIFLAMNCVYCDKTISKTNLPRHRRTCSVRNDELTRLNEENTRLKWKVILQTSELETQKEEMDKLKDELTKLKTEKISKLTKELADKTTEAEPGFNYIIHTREALRANDKVYKIGRCQCIKKRFSDYPSGSKLIHYQRTKDNKISESILKHVFGNKFTHRSDYGTEYFEGNFQDMKNEFDEILEMFG